MYIPSLEDFKLGRSALRGLRYIHTHLKDEPFNNEDITDLSLLRFDMMSAITIKDGLPHKIHIAYLMPMGSKIKYNIETEDFYKFQIDYDEFVSNLESEIGRSILLDSKSDRERAILIVADVKSRFDLEDSLSELEELAKSADIEIIDSFVQRLKEINPKFLLGEGKLREIIISAMEKGATMLIFDQELTPSQNKAITDKTELKVIDRSQLILDIFARRAHSKDGKVQVELAQLKYMLPRLSGKGTALSRLMGGIGGRGPGEMKLEIDRRRIRERISRLEDELKDLTEARNQRKKRRIGEGLPIVSIIGYTNAGKSTLLNALTNSSVFVEDKMFATLDTSSRKLRFPRQREAIITDTVGFIRDLPTPLKSAFKSTLEELEDAHLLIHLVDISNPQYEQHIQSVETILKELSLEKKPTILVFNKQDKVEANEIRRAVSIFKGICICAKNTDSLLPLLKEIEYRLWQEGVKIN
ncbi:MAG: GTPase HflX [Thermodesulfovibrionales bacterium]|nr:GTPase HflX [Thermodesulfovibrionales bacterium]